MRETSLATIPPELPATWCNLHRPQEPSTRAVPLGDLNLRHSVLSFTRVRESLECSDMKPPGMKIIATCMLASGMAFAFLGEAAAQHEPEEEPTAILTFLIIKDDNGKP